MGPSARLFVFSGQLAVLALFFSGNGKVIFFSGVRLGNKVGIDQRASPPGQRVRSICR